MSGNSNSDPLGRVLKVKRDLSALSRVTLDNGLTGTITILARPDQLPGLLDSDMAAIHQHLLTRGPGHFRVKRNR